MTDLLATGVSGLLAAQLNLSTIGNNITNAATPGYSRQTVLLSENADQQINARFTVGSGVNVAAVQRAYSQHLTEAVWNSTSGLQAATTFNDLATTLNGVLSGSGDLQGALDTFYGGFSDVANAPGDTATRQSLLGDAQSLASVFNTLGQQLDQQQNQVNTQIKNTVDSINTVSQQVADLNKQIQQASIGGNAPNALLDQRDQLVQKLAGLTGVTTVAENDGSISLYSPSGQALVSGTEAFTLSTGSDSFDASRTAVLDSDGNDITDSFANGTLGALLSYRNVLDSAQNQLGESATALAASVNQQQAKGLDLNGQQGQAIFDVGTPQVLGNHGNTGNATPSVQVGDTHKLTASDYVLTYVGAGNGTDGWSLSTRDGQSVTLTDNGDGSLSADGLTFNVDPGTQGTAQPGDSFLIRPTRDAATSLAVSLDDPDGIAAARALAASAADGNTGDADIDSVQVTDAQNPDLLQEATVTFGAGGNYTVTDADGNALATGTYDPSQPISADGWRLSLSGTPQAGDSFTVRSNGGAADGDGNGLNDNGNALDLAALSDTGVLDGGKTSVVDSFANLSNQIGTVGSQAQANLETQTSLNSQATDAQQSAAGVNLDEEAANLVRFQQAYSASAQVISTAQTLFSSLLQAVQG